MMKESSLARLRQLEKLEKSTAKQGVMALRHKLHWLLAQNFICLLLLGVSLMYLPFNSSWGLAWLSYCVVGLFFAIITFGLVRISRLVNLFDLFIEGTSKNLD